jgi:threonine synthase
MRYISTRGGTAPLSFKDAVMTGLAPDGGLLLPESLPDVADQLDRWRELGFVELAAQVMGPFVDDVPADDLRALLDSAYAGFDDPSVTPLVELDDQLTVLELFHGPTLAFKDVALQFLGVLFEYILTERGAPLNILGSTSGDTGSAAIAGVRGRKNIDIYVMFPDGRTSPLQELQMTSVTDANVHCIAVDGSFDDCQGIMKTIFNDLAFKERFHLGAVNSVNWARVLAQVVYYVYAALKLDDRGRRTVSFSVPTGNFGDILAGYLAMRMGVPIDRLICATNENDILSVFFNTGVYKRGDVRFTISPSMDIQVASNFERYLYLRLDGDSEKLKAFMEAFAATGEASLPGGGPVDEHITACAVDTEATITEIKDTYARSGYVLDPHTAVGVVAARRLKRAGPIVCLATAHPAKFPESVDEALGDGVARHPRLDALKGLASRRVELPADVEAVKRFIAETATHRK